MNICEINPTKDERWETFADNHPNASIFHTRGWLLALQRTYGYVPTAFVVPGFGSDVVSGVCFCQITGLFGRRKLVSLPFSDHCVPLIGSSDELSGYLEYLRAKVASENWNYVEIRSSETSDCESWLAADHGTFVLHKLDLRSSLEDIARGFHASCILRKINRAEHAGVRLEVGRSIELLKQFYHLLVITRRRHGLPPQPYEWFRNVIDCLGEKILIHVAYIDCRPIAAIITIRHQRSVVYKYSCSDARASNLGGTQLLMWNIIKAAKAKGLAELDLGRSETANQGLIKFKERWGAKKQDLVYQLYPARPEPGVLTKSSKVLRKYVLSRVPLTVLTAAGRVIYRFAG